MTRLRLLVPAILVLVVALACAYAYGRTTCPPPNWWLRLFGLVHPEYGCAFSGSVPR